LSRRKLTEPSKLLPDFVKKVRSPACVILGSPREVFKIASQIDAPQVDCYQLDLFQAERLHGELVQIEGAEVESMVIDRTSQAAKGIPLQMATTAARKFRVITAADLWDLPSRYQTLVYPVPERGERSLKLDLIEQSFHTLREQGTLLVLSPYEKDDLFRTALKKVYGRGIHEPQVERGAVFWCQRTGDGARRRHEITFQVRTAMGQSLRFVSRPGVFCYGRLDDGARALVETMEINPGERILDLGCGIGSNGIHAALQAGAEGSVVFQDSNLRALALADLNARNLGVSNFRTAASSALDPETLGVFDVVLANPPYYAQGDIAERFILDAWQVLRPGGRLYLVTKQLEIVGAIVAETFGDAEAVECRGYVVVCAAK